MDGLGHDLAGARMGGVALDHHRATRSQCQGSVAAGGGEGEREVRGAEDRHGADRALHHLQVRARQRLAIGQRGVVATVEMIAVANVGGEEPELAGGAAALSVEPGLGQAGLLRADPGDRGGAGLDLVGDGVEEIGTGRAGAVAEAPERVLGGLAGGVDQLGRADGEGVRGAMRRLGVEGRRAGASLPRDQVFAMRREGRVRHVGPPFPDL